jgi:transposase
VKAARAAWFERQLDLDPTRLIFIDETAASTKMARLSAKGRAMPCGDPSRTLEDNALPACSPDFNPIEMAPSKFKALLRAAASRTIDDLWEAIFDAN